ncbi:addiction module protein [Aquimarina agarilytica]|uniref:addiction module protein n=1 Tax=Aquimarina agarilytica TaxID=1087449 RepID=UPI000289341F|nr:addiction module protein [Aquimarina agarilytica]
MGTIELRNNLIDRFNRLIQDDTKLVTLEGVFDSMNTFDSSSLIPEEHYKIVEERRRKHLSGESKGKSWEEVKKGMKDKYGF